MDQVRYRVRFREAIRDYVSERAYYLPTLQDAETLSTKIQEAGFWADVTKIRKKHKVRT